MQPVRQTRQPGCINGSRRRWREREEKRKETGLKAARGGCLFILHGGGGFILMTFL